MNPSISNLESHTGYWLRLVSNQVSHAFGLKVESRGVTVAEWVVLRALFDSEGVHPSQLAQAIGLTRGAVSKLIERLILKGFVACRSEEQDRRFQVVRLTKSGRDLVPNLAALADENDRAFFGGLGKRDSAMLQSLLKQIAMRHDMKGAPVE